MTTAAPRRLDPLNLLLILALATGVMLRLIRLNAQSYWFDEAFSWDKGSRPVPEMISALIADVSHPPLHYLFLHEWLRWFPDAASAGRMLAALFGIGVLPVFYWLGREIYDRRTATIAVALMAISQLAITYSQEVRPYSQLMFFTLVATAFYVRAVERRSFLTLAAAAVSAFLALGTHYYAAFAIAALVLWHLLYARDRFPFWWLMVIAVAFAAACAPWLTSGVIDAALHAPKVIEAKQPDYFSVNWDTLFENLAAFGNARLVTVVTPASARWPVIVATALFCGPVILILRRRWEQGLLALGLAIGMGALHHAFRWVALAVVLVGLRVLIDRFPERRRRLGTVLLYVVLLAAGAYAQIKYAPLFFCFVVGLLAASPIRSWLPEIGAADEDWRRLSLLGLMVAVPIIILQLAGPVGLQYDVRYILTALPPFYLLVAHALTRFATPARRYGWLAAIVMFSTLGVHTLLTAPYKENYRDALGVLHAGYKPSECVAFVPFHETPAQWGLYRYDDALIRVLTEDQIEDPRSGCGGAWLVIYQRVEHTTRRGAVVEKAFAAHRDLIEARQFHWVRVVHFGPARPVVATR
jgi:uncharacterized membrane protein